MHVHLNAECSLILAFHTCVSKHSIKEYIIHYLIYQLIYEFISRGSAIAKIIGSNTPKFGEFENEVKMYVYEELIDGRKLTEIINTEHENVKYLPKHKLHENIVSLNLLCNHIKPLIIIL